MEEQPLIQASIMEDVAEGLDVSAVADPDCRQCGGIGYIAEDDGGALPRQHLCPCVLENRRRQAANRRIIDLFGEGGARMTIATYQTGGMDANQLALDSAKNYVQFWPKFRDGGLGFALQGPPGAGKTHLATGTLIALIKKWDVKPFYLSVPEMLRLARKRFDDPKTADVMDRAMTADIYLLDDIGAEYHRGGTEGMSWVDEQLFVILNHRLTQGLPTLYTTNLSQRDLRDRLDARVSRRLASATLAFLPLEPVEKASRAPEAMRKLLLEGDQGA